MKTIGKHMTIVYLCIIVYKINENQWKSIENNGIQWKSIEINGNQWNSMEINGIQWKSMKSNGKQYSLSTQFHSHRTLTILGAHFETATTASPAGTLS
jgi:hypothetical protein